MYNRFAKRLVELMEEKDISQVRLSELIGTTNVTISRYINGSRKPRIEIVEKMAEVLEVSVDYLLGISNVKSLPTSKVKDDYTILYHKLDDISKIISKKHFSKEQILIIEKLLETNRNFISELEYDIKENDK